MFVDLSYLRIPYKVHALDMDNKHEQGTTE